MVKLVCSDFGFECEFVSEGEDKTQVLEKFRKHINDKHGIEYSIEALKPLVD